MRLKKTLHTFFFSVLVIVYITTSIGIPVYYHYCGGQLEKVSALVKVKSCCGAMDESDSHGCCKNESQHISLKLEFATAKNVQPTFDIPFTQLFSICSLNEVFFHETTFSACAEPDSKPPDPIGLEIVRTTVFKI